MAFDKLFCPIKSSKSSRKSTAAHQQHSSNTARQNELLQQQQQQQQQQTESVDGQRRLHHTTSNNATTDNTSSNVPLRYVTVAHHATEPDEISIEPGDVVLQVPTDNQNCDSEWSYVICLTKNSKSGYVPSCVLTTEPTGLKYCIKPKKARSIVDTRTTIDLHQHSRPHSHKTHCTSERTCHSNGCSIKLQHQPNHLRLGSANHHAFELATNSAQGSSGCQTFQNYPDIHPHFSPYYNDCRALMRGPHLEPHPVCHEYQPFTREATHDAYVLHTFVPREENDLDVRHGERVTVLNTEDEDWYWVRRNDNQEGFVPSRFMLSAQKFNSVRMHKGNSTATMKSSHQNDSHTYMNQPTERKSLTTDQQSTANL